MGPIDCPETSARNYDYSLRNNPEERSSQLTLLPLTIVQCCYLQSCGGKPQSTDRTFQTLRCRPTERTSARFNLMFYSVFHNIFCLYMFLTGGFIFRQTAIATTGTVQYISTCAVHPGSSYYGFATVEAVLWVDWCVRYRHILHSYL